MHELPQHPLFLAAILVTGLGLFVRLVAKEKHRRDKHLLARLKDKEQEAQETAG